MLPFYDACNHKTRTGHHDKNKRQKDAEQKHTHRPAHTSDFRWLIKLLATLKVHGNSVAGG